MLIRSETLRATEMVSFEIGKNRYLIAASYIESVKEADAVERLPFAVFNLGSNFGEFSEHAANLKIIVLNTRGHRWGFLVERVSQVMGVYKDSFYQIPQIALPKEGFFRQVAQIERHLVLCIEPEKLFDFYNGKTPDQTANMLATKQPKASSVLSASETQNSSQKLFLFSADGSETFFGLSIKQVIEVIPSEQVCRVPYSSPMILGLVLWRSLPVPVLDIGSKFGLALKSERLVIVRIGNEQFALPASTNIKLQPLPFRYGKYSDKRFDESSVYGVFEMDRGVLVIPKLENLVAAC
ncbi:MAG: chemotaxis protein CheW [Blastocatellia bacterium]|nr:chemotaxis protein CheW [Blastocatellia bacterium]